MTRVAEAAAAGRIWAHRISIRHKTRTEKKQRNHILIVLGALWRVLLGLTLSRRCAHAAEGSLRACTMGVNTRKNAHNAPLVEANMVEACEITAKNGGRVFAIRYALPVDNSKGGGIPMGAMELIDLAKARAAAWAMVARDQQR